MTTRELADFIRDTYQHTPVLFRDKDGNLHKVTSAVKGRREPVILLETCPEEWELKIDADPKRIEEWLDNLTDEELKELGL